MERRARATAVATLVGNEGRNLVPCQWNGGMVVQGPVWDGMWHR